MSHKDAYSRDGRDFWDPGDALSHPTSHDNLPDHRLPTFLSIFGPEIDKKVGKP